jgi:hypothetical protein
MSGGPVLSKDSKVIGVISFSFTDGQNLNMAVAAKHVRELLSAKARLTAVVCQELRDRKSPAGSDDSSPIPSAQNSLAREQALVDAEAEVQSIVWASLDECELIDSDPATNGDTRLIDRAITRLQSKLPLITTSGRETESSITARLTKNCTAKELELLTDIVLSIAKAMDGVAVAFKAALMEWDRKSASLAEKFQATKRAKDTWRRVATLKDDFLDLVKTMKGVYSVRAVTPAKYFAYSARWFDSSYIYPDYDRPNLAAVLINKNPVLETNFRDGDVIEGIRVVDRDKSFRKIKDWSDVAGCFIAVSDKTLVEVRVQGGRSFYVTVTRFWSL